MFAPSLTVQKQECSDNCDTFNSPNMWICSQTWDEMYIEGSRKALVPWNGCTHWLSFPVVWKIVRSTDLAVRGGSTSQEVLYMTFALTKSRHDGKVRRPALQSSICCFLPLWNSMFVLLLLVTANWQCGSKAVMNMKKHPRWFRWLDHSNGWTFWCLQRYQVGH